MDHAISIQILTLSHFDSFYRAKPDILATFLQKIVNFKNSKGLSKTRTACIRSLLSIVNQLGDLLIVKSFLSKNKDILPVVFFDFQKGQFQEFTQLCQTTIQDEELYDNEKIMVLTSWIALKYEIFVFSQNR